MTEITWPHRTINNHSLKFWIRRRAFCRESLRSFKLMTSGAQNVVVQKHWLVVVGAGPWGTNHIRAAEEMDILGAVVETNEKARTLARSHTSALVTDSLEIAISTSTGALTGAVIATPAPSHFAVASAAIRAGLDVLVEKPMCTSVSDAEALVKLAHESNRVLMVGHLLLHGAPHQRLLQYVQKGRIGRVTRVHARRFNFGTIRTEENVLWSLSPHDVSVVLALCSSPNISEGSSSPTELTEDRMTDLRNSIDVRVSCHGQCVVQGSKGIQDYSNMMLEFEGSDVTAQIEASWLHPTKERGITVYGTEGCLMMNEAGGRDVVPGHIRLYKWNVTTDPAGNVGMTKWEVEDELTGAENDDSAWSLHVGSDASTKSPLRRELEHFELCCKERYTRKPRTSGLDGIRVTQVLVAATRSMSNGGAWENVALADQRGVTSQSAYFVHETAIVDPGARIGDGTKIWHFSHVMSGAKIGERCSFGQNTYIGGEAVVGNGVRVQNNVSVYDGVVLEDNVFIGPSAVFTNVRTPRADIPRGLAGYSSTVVGRGATVGANATVVCGVRIGWRALVGAGAVVTRNVPAHAVVVGNPARHTGWTGTRGARLVRAQTPRTRGALDLLDEKVRWLCPESGEAFRVRKGELIAEKDP